MNIIVAVDKHNGIGKDNKLLVYIKEDLQYFKNITKGNIVVMGRKTYESLPQKPLKDRENIVLTRENILFESAKVFSNIDEVLELNKSIKDKDIFICGGQSVYEQFMAYADKLYITHIFHEFDADTFFPDIGDEWEIESVEATKESIDNEYSYIWVVYKRKI
ncbi:MAG TPA: dihydrofolate reductase [Clostridiales bacterium]|nr:dihydrofolate reductase [Clostridiales bacterium]